MEYTKGEWEAEQSYSGDFLVKVGEFRPTVICHTRQDISRIDYDEMRANANLMAAAPDMYEALRDVLLLHGKDFDKLHRGVGGTTFWGKSLLAAVNALAKAEGKGE